MQPSCPAATVERNQVDLEIARCGVSGMVQLTEGSPCCGEYSVCPVWRKEKERLWQHKRPTRATGQSRTDGSLGWEST